MKTIGIPKTGYSRAKGWSPFLLWLFDGEVKIVDLNPSYGVKKLPNNIDIVLFDGGADVHPSLYGGRYHKTIHSNILRDWNERIIFDFYWSKPTKYVGICRGLQFLNVMRGGSLIEDLESEEKKHNFTHQAKIIPDTMLSEYLEIVQEDVDIVVNSFHHQSVRKLGKGLVATMFDTEFNVIEGFESKNDKIRAVQSHPEYGDTFYALRHSINSYLFRLEECRVEE